MSEHSEDLANHGRNCGYWHGHDASECTCGLQRRIYLATEREQHNAWRKRAEEAEAENKRLREALGVYADKKNWGPTVLSARPAVWLRGTHGYELAQQALEPRKGEHEKSA